MSNSKYIFKILIYVLCFYDGYVYLTAASELYRWKIKLPSLPYLSYFDAFVFLLGGIILGVMLLVFSGKVNKILGIFFIAMNIILAPFLLLNGLL
jgi:hypothetical protein